MDATGPNEVFNNASEFIANKLYFSSVTKQVPVDLFPDVHFFTIDHILVYINFYADFGPNNIAHVVRFIDILGAKMQTYQNKKICLVSAMDADKRANAAYLLCSYMMLVYKMTPEDAYRPLFNTSPTFMPYRDAGYGPATYHISILDCLQGLYRALQVGLFHIDTFNQGSYEFYEKVENGDMNWITDKFIALASPKDDVSRLPMSMGRFGLPPLPKKENNLYSIAPIDNLIRYFKENNVCTIVRLNNKLYERKRFVDAGIEHIEMYFPDGSTPPDNILQEFLELCENRKGVIAVHCKAGLGRTGSLIAAYLMKHYRLTAAETISFLRVIRPGSVVGPQQNWLQSMQNKIWSWTPERSIDSSFSFLRPSSLTTSKRFEAYRQAVPFTISATLQPSAALAEKIEYAITSSDEEDETSQDQEMGDTPTIRKLSNNSYNYGSGNNTRSSTLKNHFKVVKGNNTIHKNMTDHMAVPIQPRKGMSNPSLDKDEPLAQEAQPNRYEGYVVSVSKIARPGSQRMATTDKQQYVTNGASSVNQTTRRT